jgi:hypothetical protein
VGAGAVLALFTAIYGKLIGNTGINDRMSYGAVFLEDWEQIEC